MYNDINREKMRNYVIKGVFLYLICVKICIINKKKDKKKGG